jgi:phosphoglycerol transferase MdoB-like AlkP superfamily enzyme
MTVWFKYILSAAVLLNAGWMFSGTDHLCKAEIRYENSSASEVYMVWGINSWQIPPQDIMPPGSFVRDKLVYTPMSRFNGTFSSVFDVPAGTSIDYVFWITRGPLDLGTDVWDTNGKKGKDFHTVVEKDGATLIPATVTAYPAQQLTVFDFSKLWWIVSGILFVVLLFFYRRYAVFPLKYESLVFALTLGMLPVVILVRSSVMKISWDLYLNPGSKIGQVISGSFYDVVYFFTLALVFYFLLRIFKARIILRKIFFYSFAVISFVSLVVTITNEKIVEMLGRPFNYQWLYYADFLRSADAKIAVGSNLNAGYLAGIISLVVFCVCLGLTIAPVIRYFLEHARLRKISVLIFLCLGISYVAISRKSISENQWDKKRLVNPVVSFLGSVNPFGQNPELFTMVVPDSLKYQVISPRNSKACWDGIHNVLFFVLESTPWEYVSLYNNTFSATPILEKYREKSIMFNDLYAHAPATNLSMFSMLCSQYPWLSYRSLTEEHPDLAMSSLPSLLKEKGYRSAFFNSGDNRFQKAGEFLRARGFDLVDDYTQLQCEQKGLRADSDWNFMDGANDACTAKAMVDWIVKDPKTPFFSMMWSYQTHYPYFADAPLQHYSNDSMQNKYLNAVHHSDSVLGIVLSGLEEKGLSRSTLVIVVGDHGEAFGRHDQVTHGRKIYEENLHIPCVLINPCFKYQQINNIGGLVDLPATVLNILGLKCPEEWTGRNLFEKNADRRTYFFAPWSDFLFGYREGDRKVIFNATTGATEVYDLSVDPLESEDISGEFSKKDLNLFHERLAAWAQYANGKMNKIISKTQRAEVAHR